MAEDDKKNEIIKEIAKDVYVDVGHPVAKPTGELAGLVPRAIKAALAPVEKWVLQREYNVAQTKKLLEEKLKNVPPKFIEPPEAHIAVPVIQYISYCMDNEELRNMYANLLANSMNKIVKNGVHPGYVEIIKQLSPDEAKIMRYFYTHKKVPTITIRRSDKNGYGTDLKRNFSNIGEIVECERPLDISVYFDNLIRLGLLKGANGYASLVNKNVYEPLKKHSYVVSFIKNAKGLEKYQNKTLKFKESYISITDFGKSFCKMCISDDKI